MVFKVEDQSYNDPNEEAGIPEASLRVLAYDLRIRKYEINTR
ncbi:predicted protein [Sclerotinia sclerotiorum 1980 UF-70]|uniref:Uncharacterized protein n=1 Tax=Sclerotinia sclerotiorum (strain ATCC 18683 / 1980 / Ss-1) TaxID=665079 RepID=A7ED50_SCLS1|nr:predicted protein [Sclerotinia sclerotiorum 1980 UF-70]EDO00766.1 predicted protein [Sclerotinia sclerotiorum 1980 UF-70]